MDMRGFCSTTAVFLAVAIMLAPTAGLLLMPGAPSVEAGPPTSRDGQGTLEKVVNPWTNPLRGVTWKKGTKEGYMVGSGIILKYTDSNGSIEKISSTESDDIYYEDIAWRPQGDFAIAVGAATISTKNKGVISKVWKEGSTWRVTALSTSIDTRLTGIDWAPDGSYAVLVGGARGGESEGVAAIMLRFSPSSGQWTEIYSDTTSGLSDVSYNPAFEYFHACGLDGRMVQYDGTGHWLVTDNGLRNSELFSITWRDNGGRGIMGGWFSGTLKGHLVTTDGLHHSIVTETTKYMNDADWAPGSDYSLLVGQSGAIWEYSVTEGLVDIENTLDSKHYFGVDFDDTGEVALVVGGDGSVLRYSVNYPSKENFPPLVKIASPADGSYFDYAQEVVFDSNGTHDDDLDELDYEWRSSLDGRLSTQTYVTSASLSPGKHTITLTVSDNHSHSVNTTVNITVRAPPDPPIVATDVDIIGYAGEEVTLNGMIKRADYDIETYEWDYYNDGVFYGSKGPKATHVYEEPGFYVALFRATDIRMARGSAPLNITIFPALSDADGLVSVLSTDYRIGDKATIQINHSNAKKLSVHYVAPNKKEYPVGGKINGGNLTVEISISKSFKNGNYDIKWTYYDRKDNPTEWYTKEDVFHVKVTDENGGGIGDYAGYIVAAILVVIILVVIIFAVMRLIKKSRTRLETTLLAYRDGRVMTTHTPSMPGDGSAVQSSHEVTAQVQGVLYQQVEALRQGRSRGLPSSVQHGLYNVVIEQGMHTILVVALTGPEPGDLRKRMKNSIQEIEILYGNSLRQWDGTTTEMTRLQPILDKNIRVEE